MRSLWTSPLLRTAALSLRALADRFEPRTEPETRRSPAPLVRIGGHWWHADELIELEPDDRR